MEPVKRDRKLVGGLLSGTSLDGVDALLLSVGGEGPDSLDWEVVGFRSDPYTGEERERVARAISQGGVRELALLGRDLSRRFAEVFLELLHEIGVDAGEVAAVGSHGQTVWHEPPTPQGRGATLQIGCPATLAETLGCPVVSDFRARDMAAGGHGAPLVPWADWALLRRPGVGRALQNLGGMGNVTFLPADGRLAGVLGFDTGPGVALLDGAARRASHGKEPWDAEGRRAARGRVIPELLEDLLADPFFTLPPPRSTGRERFGEPRLDEIVARVQPESDASWDDLLATLTALTAQSIAQAYRDFLPSGGMHEVVLAGGGARNPTLVRKIAEALDPLPVRTGAEALGLDPDAREAAAFALLAWAHLQGVPANVPAVTGASGPRILGSLTPGSERS
ncbi:MAG: anhydro-N-acetylmuramic acid kinase [Gemmatimonadota bacterium]